ncbi:flagellar basal body rod modification protein [Enterococcus saccharolyticus]|uniref:Flagellar basal body rod modification protein n=2 Tax=Enterococcus TaxID=1350 RepID=A0ABQ6YXY6_9ENTE|nr:flagellar basal body rod modification protein [Enterococcus sp. CU12B]MCD5002880.1 flagellar basal body rod modification protein [Enterococcus saccharolyticus]
MTPLYSPATAAANQKERSSDISMDDFLKILAATMSNPTVSAGGESGGNAGTDYVGQFVQFTTLQQIKEIGDGLSQSVRMTQQQQAFDLLGREVTVKVDDENNVTGKVEKVRFVDGYATIVVNGEEYYMSGVQEIGEKK